MRQRHLTKMEIFCATNVSTRSIETDSKEQAIREPEIFAPMLEAFNSLSQVQAEVISSKYNLENIETHAIHKSSFPSLIK